MADKGTCTLTEERLGQVKKLTFAWTSGTGGDAGLVTKTTTYPYNGAILAVCTVPGSAGDQPTNLYDIVLNDANSVDVLNAQAANRSNASTEWVVSSLGYVVGSALTLSISNAGDTKKGTLYIYIGGPMSNLSTAYTDLANALYGADGIATYPAAAAAGDGVSMAEVLRYIQQRAVQSNSVALAAANLTGTTTRFTVAGGPIAVKHLGLLVTTNIPAGANTCLFSFTPTGGAATNLCGATDTASAGAQQLFIVDGVKATALVKTTDVGIAVAANEHMPIVLGTGVIQTIFSAGPPASGAATAFIEWEPLAPASTVT